VTIVPTEAEEGRLWNGRVRPTYTSPHTWEDLDRNTVVHRYDRLAPLIPLFDWIFFQPRAFRRNAVERLALNRGDRVLEVGCGTGRNLPFLRDAVGPTGSVYGVDISAGMLAKARNLCRREQWANVALTEQDAAEYVAPEPLDGVMFGLSYNTMPHHRAVLQHAWDQLRPGGRLVVMDSRLPPWLVGKLMLPFSLWLMRRTMMSNPLLSPWEDVARLGGAFAMEEFMLGSWYICRATKPLSAPAI
jgi:demethylmenaquinone methyltransferase/2-methoxy-6-polyprenyl-1,4-benzoquinol methylase